MIVEMNATTAASVANRLVEVREEGGVVALGRVLTLIMMASPDRVEEAIELANGASREHPSRVIVIDVDQRLDVPDGLDAEIRVGADAGASEVVLLRPRGGAAQELDTLITPLLLPDTPIVAMWIGITPEDPAHTRVGSMASRRITDAVTGPCPRESFIAIARHHTPGDTDLSWARITLWRALIASQFESTLPDVTRIELTANPERPGTHLLAGWLRDRLDVPVTIEVAEGDVIERVHLEFVDSTYITLHRPPGSAMATLSRSGMRDQMTSLPPRTVADCLMEDLRRLDADVTYAQALAHVEDN